MQRACTHDKEGRVRAREGKRGRAEEEEEEEEEGEKEGSESERERRSRKGTNVAEATARWQRRRSERFRGAVEATNRDCGTRETSLPHALSISGSAKESKRERERERDKKENKKRVCVSI